MKEQAMTQLRQEPPRAAEKIDHNFDEGMGRRPRPQRLRRIGRFSLGLARERLPWRRPRFSRGMERQPGDLPEKEKLGRFSEGLDLESPDSPQRDR
jgi:hypothetical protein